MASFKEQKTLAETATISTLSINDDVSSYTVCDDGRYEVYSKYLDENLSSVDDAKNINVNSKQINITQEENSQFIPFRIPRYWDGIDLLDMFIQIHYENTLGEGQVSNAVNVKYDESHIIFGWLVDSNVTAKAGEIKFEITATGVNEKGNTYVWKTRPNGKLTVIQGLSYNGIIEPTDEWYTGFVNTMLSHVAEAKTYAEAAAASAESIDVSTIKQEVKEEINADTDTKIAENLVNYYPKTDVDSFISTLNERISGINGLANLNITYDNVTGKMTFKDGDTIISDFTINSLSNLNVKYTIKNGKGNLAFFDGETEITSVELSEIEPSTEWTNSLRNTITEEINSKVSTASSTLSEEIATLENQINGIDLSTIKEDIVTIRDEVETAKTNIGELTENINTANAEATAAKNTATIAKNTADANTTLISETSESISNLETRTSELEKNPGKTYDVSYVDNIFTLTENDEIKQQFTITGGSGGGTATSTITITRITEDGSVVLLGDKAIIAFEFTSVDNSGDTTGAGTATWRVGNTTVATVPVSQGRNEFDITQYLKTGANNIRLSITDSFGSMSAKTWGITIVDFKLESIFDDSLFYSDDITFRYTPYGEIEKNIAFILDGQEIGGITTAISGRQMTYNIQKQTHGSHLLEVYMTATINGQAIRSASIYKDIIWIDADSDEAIISCAIPKFTATQYNTTPIYYTVYDPKNNPATVELSVDGKLLSTLSVDRTQKVWSYKSSTNGEQELTISCRNALKTIEATIEKLEIDVEPVTTGLQFDFNPTGKSNGETDWLKINDTLTISVSDNFDTTNGGYQADEDGDTYFCVKAGTTATIPYKLFADDAKENGKNFKLIYKTTNVKNYDANAVTCMDGGIGLTVNAQQATLSSEQNHIEVAYCEDNYMELEFNILPDKQFTEMVMWLDAVPSRVKLYSSTDIFTQPNPVGITIGSDDCDVWIYRIKAYNINLTDDEILDNRIADAKNADEMVARYKRNQIVDATGNLDPDLIAEVCKGLRVIKMSVPHFATSKTKIEGCTVQQIFKSGRAIDNWIAENVVHKGQGTSSIQYGDSALNIDIDCKGGFTFEDGTTSPTYPMTENSMPEKYFNIKVNVASSENANNSVLADDYNTYNPHIRKAKENDSRVRDTMEFHPCVIFVQETDIENAVLWKDGQYHFYACGDFGNSKKNASTMGMDSDNHKECIIEVSNNTSELGRFLSDDFSNELWNGDTAFEPRYPDSWEGYTEEEVSACKQAWIDLVSWVFHATPEEFVRDFDKHFVKESMLFHYLYTTRHTMVDNRSKNVFFHTEDLVHWDVSFDYDNDTGEGNDNEGGLTLTYGYEDTDTIGTKDVFNAADNKLWCYIRDYFADELKSLYIQLEGKLAWSSTRILNKFESYQSVKSERLVMADMRRKYFRPYEENGITTYLEMMHGDKKHQRRQFEVYQDKYMASKFMGATSTSDAITIRGYTPTNWTGVKPDGTFHIKPYADIYINCRYGGTPVSTRAKRGQTYTIECPISAMNDTEVYVYSSSMIQSVGDISAFYPGYTNFAMAEKITDLHIGSEISGYQNTNMDSFDVGNNKLLEQLNLQNLPNLKKTIDLSGCVNLEEFVANGSGITGVIFATGGKISTAHLPAISSLTAKNLYNLNNLVIEDFTNITTLTIESCPTIDILSVIDKCKNLNRVRFTGINWNLDSTDLLDKLAKLAGINENGYNISTSVLAGKVHVPVMREQKLKYYSSIWSDLEITYDAMITQYTVTFVNDDENETVLDVQYIDMGQSAVDPITREEDPIPIPTKESTVSTNFTFNKWNDTFTNIMGDKTIKAVYSESVREYTVKYVSKGTTLQETNALYGSFVEYEGALPTYTAEETAYRYNLFERWDKSGFVDGNKTINAIYQSCQYKTGYFDNKELSDLSEVEIYMLMKMNLENGTKENNENGVLQYQDQLDFQFGIDYNYDDVEENEIISATTNFDGSNYIDTGISLFEEDRDFTLTIDFEFDSDNTNGATLAQCYMENSYDGFRLWHSSQHQLSWGSDSTIPSYGTQREIVVLRHKKGTNKVTVYNSNITGQESSSVELESIRIPTINSTLVFGAKKSDDGTSYSKYAKGKIYWCKIWYADLGEEKCKTLVSWVHESIPMEVSEFKGYYLANSTTQAKITFVGSNLLSVQRCWNNVGNKISYCSSSLNTWLNDRLYNAISPLWKTLIKQVTVKANTGVYNSKDVMQTDAYFYIPSVCEITAGESGYNTSPYSLEQNEIIPYMNDRLIRRRAKTSTPDLYEPYWTRSANVSREYSNAYVFNVTDAGEINSMGFSTDTSTYGILPMFSIYA